MRYLVDTSTCIHAMRGNQYVVARMSAIVPSDIAVSSITCYELFTGAAKCRDPRLERSKVELFVGTLKELAFDRDAASHAALIRAELESRGEMIGPYDVLIAGHAKSMGLTIVTGNTKEFTRVAGLQIENWQAASP
jgi:tRNA(fMet)-specific endonuclease VapC